MCRGSQESALVFDGAAQCAEARVQVRWYLMETHSVPGLTRTSALVFDGAAQCAEGRAVMSA